MVTAPSLIEIINRQTGFVKGVLAFWLLVVVFIATGAASYMEVSKDIRFAEKEYQGTLDNRILVELLYDFARLRQNLLTVENSREKSADIKALIEEINGDLETYPVRLRVYEISDIDNEPWAGWKETLRAISKDPGIRHEAALLKIMQELRSLIIIVTNASNLILDPSHDSYFLMDISALVMPEVVESLSIIGHLAQHPEGRSFGKLGLRHDESGPMYLEKLSYLSSTRLPASLKSAVHDHQFSKGLGLFQALQVRSDEFTMASKALIVLISQGGYDKNMDVLEDAIARTTDSAEQVSVQASAGLEFLLSERLAAMRWQQVKSSLWSLIFSVIILSVVVLVFKTRRDASIIKDQARLLNLALEASQDGIWQKNYETGEFYVSPQMLRIFGYKEGELIGESATLEAVFDSDDLARICALSKCARAGETVNFRGVVGGRHKDGTPLQIFCRIISQRDDQSRVLKLVGAVTDVTNIERDKGKAG